MRKAMLYAFNRPKVVNQVLGGLGEALQPSLFSSAYSALGWPNSTDPYGYDPSKAKMLLNNEGFIGSAPFRVDPSTGDTLRSMQIISRLSQPGEVAAADLFAKDMQAIGLPIVSVPMSDRDFNQAIRIYSFDIFIDSKPANSAPTWLYDLFVSKNDISPVPLGSNLVGYRSSRFDNYVRELVTAKNQSDVEYAASKCQETLIADLPAIPVFSKDLLLASSRFPVATVIGSLGETVRSTVVRILKDAAFSSPFRIGLASSFDDLDPTTSSNQADWIALRLLTEPLLSTDQEGRLEPGLVTQWMVSDDGTSITLSIRQDARFDNGQSITVNDVAATLNWLIHNVKPSSPLNVLMKETSRAYVLDQKTVRVALSRPDKFAVNQLTELFALPEARLRNNPYMLDPLRNQRIVSSGPLALREFTQRDGVYMQLSNSYFGKPVEIAASIQVFEQVTVHGFMVLPGSEVRISSSPLLFKGQPVRNASYRLCVYDQSDFATECVLGGYLGYGTYSTILHVDSRFHVGSYRVESTVSGSLANGTFIIFQQNTMMVSASPPIPLLLFTILMLAAVIGFRGLKMVPPRRGQRIQPGNGSLRNTSKLRRKSVRRVR
jgi:ABC-type transport system substrate-binding protein